MARLAAVVAAAATRGTAAQTECRAVGLNMTETLAVVALLGLSGAWQRAAVRLVARLLAYQSASVHELRKVLQEKAVHTVVAKTLGGRAHLGVVADIATLVARATREGRHFRRVLGILVIARCQ